MLSALRLFLLHFRREADGLNAILAALRAGADAYQVSLTFGVVDNVQDVLAWDNIAPAGQAADKLSGFIRGLDVRVRDRRCQFIGVFAR